jgi:hypothetical protein
VIVARDGQLLGKVTTNQFDGDSILNEFGEYGGQFSPTSIFNKFGEYGGEFSTLSPFNEFSTTPPRIVCGDGTFIFLTRNRFMSPSIDPYLLVGLLKSSR